MNASQAGRQPVKHNQGCNGRTTVAKLLSKEPDGNHR